ETDATLEDVTIVDNGDGTLTITQDLMGAIDDAVPSNSAENGAGSILAETVTEGADSNFQDTHFTLEDEDGNAFYAWFNVNGEGTDPAETGTGLEVAIAAGASAASVGAAIAS